MLEKSKRKFWNKKRLTLEACFGKITERLRERRSQVQKQAECLKKDLKNPKKVLDKRKNEW